MKIKSNPKQLTIDSAPRSCNTGAHISCAPSLKIDWLEMTLRGFRTDEIICDYLGLCETQFAAAERGMQGYPNMLTYGQVKVLFNSYSDEKGVKVILSAQALDEIAADAISIIKKGVDSAATFARIDIAMDDRNGLLQFEEIETLCLTGYVVTNFTQYDILKPRCTKTNDLIGRSVRWGSPSSERKVICYDKQLERINKTGEDPGHWIRIEGRWYKRSAKRLAEEIAQNGLENGGAVIRGLIDFREKTNDNTTRRQPMQWWVEFTNAPEIVRTGLKKLATSIQRKSEWLMTQIRKPLGQVAAYFGPDHINAIIRDGIEATTNQEWKALDPHNIRLDWSDFYPEGTFKVPLDCPF